MKKSFLTAALISGIAGILTTVIGALFRILYWSGAYIIQIAGYALVAAAVVAFIISLVVKNRD